MRRMLIRKLIGQGNLDSSTREWSWTINPGTLKPLHKYTMIIGTTTGYTLTYEVMPNVSGYWTISCPMNDDCGGFYMDNSFNNLTVITGGDGPDNIYVYSEED